MLPTLYSENGRLKMAEKWQKLWQKLFATGLHVFMFTYMHM